MPVETHLDLPAALRERRQGLWMRAVEPVMVAFLGKRGDPSPYAPVRIREQGYRYLISYLGQHLKNAELLRIDHVTGFHRLFWIPNGPGPRGARTATLRACAAFLSASLARTVLINLEDLWLETLPQNVPNTCQERPNWRWKARYSFEAFSRMAEVVEILQELDHQRRGGGVLNPANKYGGRRWKS